MRSGSKWSQGFIYLANFNRPYLLWAPAILLVGLGLVALVTRGRPWWIRRASPPGYGWVARRVQSPTAVVIFMIVSGLLQAIYWIRQGGDFMHGRVLLTPVFLLLAPVAVIPMALPDGVQMPRGAGYLFAGATGVLWLAVAIWSLWAANSPGMGADATRVTYTGIVDERRFYSQATGNAHPLTAADYLDYPAHARGARCPAQHARRRAAVAVRQLRPMGCGARRCRLHLIFRPMRGRTTRARTQCFSPISACLA